MSVEQPKRSAWLFAVITAVGLLVVALLIPTSALGDSVDQLARRLVGLRGEVETLQADLDQEKTEHHARMTSLATQRSELEAAVRREELKLKRLGRTLASTRARTEQAGVFADELLPLLREAIAALRLRIETGLPFQVDERKAALAELEKQLDSRVLPPAKALARLWALHEDEIRLATDNGLYRQTMTLDGEERIADVVRLGMVMLYFWAGDRMGFALQQNGAWRFHEVPSASERHQIAALFDSFAKQVRTGYFELPNPYAQASFP
jgi:hypothetical protein